MASSRQLVGMLVPTLQAGAFSHLRMPRGAGAPATLWLRSHRRTQWQLAGDAEVLGSCGMAPAAPGLGAAPSTCCWCAAPLPESSGPAVWILPPTLHLGEVLHMSGPDGLEQLLR